MRRKLDKEEYEQQTINMKVHVYLLAHLRLVYHICCLQVFLFFFYSILGNLFLHDPAWTHSCPESRKQTVDESKKGCIKWEWEHELKASMEGSTLYPLLWSTTLCQETEPDLTPTPASFSFNTHHKPWRVPLLLVRTNTAECVATNGFKMMNFH